jgi:very-short-patch-repair endonuclease
MSTPEADVWERGKTRIRYVKGLRRTEIIYPIECPNCGKERWLKKWDALRALQNNCLCYRCSQSAKGRLGWLVTTAKWGAETALKHLRNYRLANPSNLEREVMKLLDELSLPYEREVFCECAGRIYLIDFVVAESLAIEVNGDYFHSQRQEADARKIRDLEACAYLVLVLSETQIQMGEAQAILQNHLAQI